MPEADSPLQSQAGPALDREQWLQQCASHFMTQGGLGSVDAMQAARTCLDLGRGDKDPAVAAQEEMSTWED